MKRIVSLIGLLLATALLLAGCEPENRTASTNRDPQTSPPLLQEYDGPLVYSTLDAFVSGVEETKNKNLFSLEEQSDPYNVGAISFYYEPAWLPDNAVLYSVRVRDLYVALYYKVGVLAQTEADEVPYGKEELTSTVMFEWTRIADGETRLENQVETLGLTAWGETDADPVYYTDIQWYEDPDTDIGRQFYWVEDGYLFSMYIPNSETEDGTTLDALQISLDE